LKAGDSCAKKKEHSFFFRRLPGDKKGEEKMSLSPGALAAASARHPWRVIALWLGALVIAGALASLFLSDALTTEQKFTNTSEARKGLDLLAQRLTGPRQDDEAVVVHSDSLTVDDPAFRALVEGISSRITALGPDIVSGSVDFYQTNDPSLVSRDRHATMIPVRMAGGIADANANVGKLIEAVQAAEDKDGFQVYVSGNASIGHEFRKVAERDLTSAEQIGIPIALVVLVLVFGALAAALVPVVLALIAIGIAVGVTALFGFGFQFSFFVTNMITMMGLAVGIDYSLFIVSRYREERARGLEEHDAIAAAGGTAGRAVLFSGMTVVLALLGMLIIPTTVFRSLASGAIFAVVGAVLASLTLLPAILSLLGDRVNALKVPFVGRMQHRLDDEHPGGFWDFVSRTVMSHPVISLVAAASILIAAAVPFFRINLSTAGVSTLPDSFQSKKGFEVLKRDFAGGQVYPVQVVLDGKVNDASVAAAVERLKAEVAQDPTFGPASYQVNGAQDLALLSFSTAADPNSGQTMDAVRGLRKDVREAFKGTPVKPYVTGFTALNIDFLDLTDHYTPVVFAFVLGLSFVLLMVVFRSVVVPAKAILLNLLSVGAAYGMIVLVFQEGFLHSLFGFQQVDGIEPWLPLFLFSVLFGLSMDYHVFLLSRIREHYDESGDNTESVAFGVRSTGRLITGAALIMVAVFSGFASGQMTMFQQTGFGLAVAVLVDATVIRSVLVPASMKLLGRANWWLPPVLGWLPRVGIEGRRSAAPQRYQAEPRSSA
jgi:RND superfamily putative drug exporter